MPDKNFLNTPLEFVAEPKGNRGGPGEYDGEGGLPKRTHSPNGVPEKVRDGSVPSFDKKGVILPDQMPKHLE